MIRVDGQIYVKSQDVLRTLKSSSLQIFIISTKSLVLKKYVHFEGLPPTKYERLRHVNLFWTTLNNIKPDKLMRKNFPKYPKAGVL